MKHAATAREPIFHPKIQAFVVALIWDGRTQHGKLVLDDGGWPDMSGTIAVFEAVDPGCSQIDVYQGRFRSCRYYKIGSEWEAHFFEAFTG